MSKPKLEIRPMTRLSTGQWIVCPPHAAQQWSVGYCHSGDKWCSLSRWATKAQAQGILTSETNRQLPPPAAKPTLGARFPTSGRKLYAASLTLEQYLNRSKEQQS